jgi:hypothetical protein
VIDEKGEAIKKALTAVREVCQLFSEDKENIPKIISERYGLNPEDAKKWYSGVKITATNYISVVALEIAVATLCDVQVLSTRDIRFQSLYDPRFVELQVDFKG